MPSKNLTPICDEVVDLVADTFIPSNIVDTNLKLLNIVVKKEVKYILRKRTVYESTDLKLQDILTLPNDSKQKIKIVEESVTEFLEKDVHQQRNIIARVARYVEKWCTGREEKFVFRLHNLSIFSVENQEELRTQISAGKINIDHQKVQAIKKEKNVLCVIVKVIQPKTGVIERSVNTGGNIKVLQGIADVTADGSASSKTKMDLSGIVLAFQVLELNIYADGSCLPVVSSDGGGGFPSSDSKSMSYSENQGNMHVSDAELTEAKTSIMDRTEPLRHAVETETESDFKSSLQKLMKCKTDVVELLHLLSKVKNGVKVEKNDFTEQLVNTEAVLSLLERTGVSTKDGTLSYEGKTTPMFTAVALFFCALDELDHTDLENLSQCKEEELKVLLDIFEFTVTMKASGKRFPLESLRLLETPAVDFLEGLGFGVTIEPTELGLRLAKPAALATECAYCVLYCLCGKIYEF